jgi:hypothetical protein
MEYDLLDRLILENASSTPGSININMDMTIPADNLGLDGRDITVDGATYNINRGVFAGFTVTDAGSGVVTTTSTVGDGELIDTSTSGAHTFTIEAWDNAGNMTTTTINYTVVIPVENIDPGNTGSQYAYGENVGWINFKPSYGPGVTVTDTMVTGFVWHENIGWINLNPSQGGVVNDGIGNLSGYAWSENAGWINFGPNGSGVTITSGDFDGWAWGENIGWLHFQNQTIPYVVQTGWESSLDSDGDGVPDNVDVCPGFDDNADADGDGVADGCDVCPGSDDNVDTDNDGTPDGCDSTPTGDDDNDGVDNAVDQCPGSDDNLDADGDTIPDGCDVCPGSDDRVDSDGDGTPDGCDSTPTGDDDNDGVDNAVDQCPGSDDNLDADGDGVADGCDICPGSDDNVDTDNDGTPDGCDPDDDNDGVPDAQDNCPLTPNADQADCDGDGIGDACDTTDSAPPVALAKNITVQLDATGNASITAAQVDNGSYDTCSNVTLSVSPNAFTCANIGANTVTLTVTDNNENSNIATATVTVEDTTLPSLTVPADVTVECTGDTNSAATGVATGSDTCGSVTITESDTSVPGCGNTEVITRTWTVTDESGNSISGDQIITVVDTTPPSLTVPADVTVECTGDTSSAATGIATGSDTCGSVTITESDSSVAGIGNTEVITRTWTATDACGNSTSANQTITVVDTTPPSLTVPADVNVECTGDTSSVATGVATGSDTCGSVTITESDTSVPGCGNTEVITRTWTVTDESNNVTSRTQTITVEDTTPPTIASAAATPDYVAINSLVVISAVVADTCSTSTSSEYSIDGGINWTDTSIALNSGAVSRIIDVKVRAKDECGNVSSTTIDFFLPVYDPSAGFVTGGGWVDSPAGAYKPDGSLSGKANFGFVSKYKKGATTPTGSTEFVFHAAGMNFHSSVYQWLVVTGANYAQYKGEGTINGAGSYKFKLWAGDGAPDTFRIKIYTESGGVETIVYDNGFDQAIGGGSIVIHAGGKGK